MSQVRLSVNVNKIATLRNARGGQVPDILRGVSAIVDAGAPGITVHPRADERHITHADVVGIAEHLRNKHPETEFNVEGDPRESWVQLVEQVEPTQATLVPVLPGEITSQAGWSPELGSEALPEVIRRIKDRGIRVSVFVDPELGALDWAARAGADRVELYTEPFARAFLSGDPGPELERYTAASARAAELGLGVNAGHDLDLANLGALVAALPRLDEVSIGHALVSEALFDGLDAVVRRYLACLSGR